MIAAWRGMYGVSGGSGLLRVVSYGDFLEFGRLLAADAIARLEGYDIADLAEVTYAIQFAVFDGEKSLHLEGPLRFHRPLEPHLTVGQALVQERVEQISGVGGERLLFVLDPDHRAVA